MDIKNSTFLITGGTAGIGQGFAKAILAEGGRVIVCGRRVDRLDDLAQTHAGLVTRACDLSRDEERVALYEWVTKHHPDTNVLMNNAGMQLLADLTLPVDLEGVRAEVETNLIAPLHLMSLFAGHLASKSSAAIVNISSGLAFCPIAPMAVYCATKAAIHSLTVSLRFQLRNTSVKVIEIIPPAVDTELGHQRRADKTKTHGGMSVAEFLAEAMEAIREDLPEAPIAMSKGMYLKREELFDVINKSFEERYR